MPSTTAKPVQKTAMHRATAPAAAAAPASRTPVAPKLDQPIRFTGQQAVAWQIRFVSIVLWVCERAQHAPLWLADLTIGATKNQALEEWPAEVAQRAYAAVRRVTFIEEDRPALIEVLARAHNLTDEQRCKLLRAASELPWEEAIESIQRTLSAEQ